MAEQISTTENQDMAPGETDTGSGKTIAMVVYGLQAASFLLGITFIIAVIVAYVKRGDMRGTYLESHCRWQIRTFWFSLLWVVIGFITIPVLFVFSWLIFAANAIWVIYRIVKGFVRLADGKAMYA